MLPDYSCIGDLHPPPGFNLDGRRYVNWDAKQEREELEKHRIERAATYDAFPTTDIPHILNMPMELLLYTTGFLHPRDIHHLCEAHKPFNDLFMADTEFMETFWETSLLALVDLPERPVPLSAKSYAALLFGSRCMNCGGAPITVVSFALHARLCSFCCSVRLVTLGNIDSDVKYEAGEVALYSIVTIPADANMSARGTTTRLWDKLEIEQRLQKLNQMNLEASGDALRVYKKRCMPNIMRRVRWSENLTKWFFRDRITKDWALSRRRHDEIITRLRGMGYSAKDFPEDTQYQWSMALDPPRPLTQDEWEELRPIVISYITIVQQQSVGKRRNAQYGQFEEAYTESFPSNVFPNARVSFHLPSIQGKIAEGNFDVKFDGDVFNSLRSKMAEDISEFVSSTNAAVSARRGSLNLPASGNDFVAVLSPCGSLMSSSDVIDHSVVCAMSCSRVFGQPRWLDGWKFDGIIAETTRRLLLLFDSDFDEARQKKFWCRCGNPDLKRPCSFEKLVLHIAAEQQDYANKAKWLQKLSDSRCQDRKGRILINDHDLDDVANFARCLVPRDPVVRPPRGSPLERSTKCQFCYLMTTASVHFECEGYRNYHMLAKHGVHS